jgi:hypothetical protein
MKTDYSQGDKEVTYAVEFLQFGYFQPGPTGPVGEWWSVYNREKDPTAVVDDPAVFTSLAEACAFEDSLTDPILNTRVVRVTREAINREVA